MANVPRSSFIPKQVTSSAIPKKVRHTRVFSIFSFIAGTLFFLSLVASGGVYFLKTMEVRKLENERAALEAERAKFNEEDIREVREFNERIELAQSLLDTHVSPSKIFSALEASTKQSVQYTSLAYVRRPSGDVSLDIFGVTDDFAKVALQSMQYSEDFILKDAAVTEVGINLGTAEGEAAASAGKQVSFKIISNIEASKIAFEPASVPDMPLPQTEAATSTGESTVATSTPPAVSSPAGTVPEEGDAVPGIAE